jgi:FkbM family methyltransferase
MISYAQNHEDLTLWLALQNVPGGFYIDVGAAHPEFLSVTKIFYDHGWHGINIEPQGEMIELLRAARPRDINLCITAGDTTGSGVYMNYDHGVGIVSNDPEIRDIFEHNGHHGHEALLGQMTLTDILEHHPPPNGQIHFLKVDCEGSEMKVFQGLDLERYRPWMIVAEAILPTTFYRTDQPWRPYLLNNHYRFVFFDGQNCFYVANERYHSLRSTWTLE